MQINPLTREEMTEGRMVTLAPGSTAVWRIEFVGDDYVVLDGVQMDNYVFERNGNGTPQTFRDLNAVNLYPHG
jgi:hypothetical protein